MRTLLSPYEEEQLESQYLHSLTHAILRNPSIYQTLYTNLDLGIAPPVSFVSVQQVVEALYNSTVLNDEVVETLTQILPIVYDKIHNPYMIAPTRSGQEVLDTTAYDMSRYPVSWLLDQLHKYQIPRGWTATTTSELSYLLARMRLGLIPDPLTAQMIHANLEDSEARLRNTIRQIDPNTPLPDNIHQLYELFKTLVVTIPSYRAHSIASEEYKQVVTSYLNPWLQAIDTNPQQVVSKLGIVVPPGMDIVKYLKDNIGSYLPVISSRYDRLPDTATLVHSEHPDYILEHYSDSTLLSMAYVSYRSREQLIDKLRSLISYPSFFIVSNCHGVAYGTLFNYECYKLHQLELTRQIKPGLFTEVQLPDGQLVVGQAVAELRQLMKDVPDLNT